MKKLENIILDVAGEFNNTLSRKIAVENGRDAAIYGNGGVLDSLGLVSFIVLVEEAIENNYGKSIILANEKAISARNTPFLTVATLCDHCESLLKDEGVHE